MYRCLSRSWAVSIPENVCWCLGVMFVAIGYGFILGLGYLGLGSFLGGDCDF